MYAKKNRFVCLVALAAIAEIYGNPVVADSHVNSIPAVDVNGTGIPQVESGAPVADPVGIPMTGSVTPLNDSVTPQASVESPVPIANSDLATLREQTKLKVEAELEQRRVEYLKNKRERLRLEQQIQKGNFSDTPESSMLQGLPMGNLGSPVSTSPIFQVPDPIVTKAPSQAVENPQAKPVGKQSKPELVLKGIEGLDGDIRIRIQDSVSIRVYRLGDSVNGWVIVDSGPDYVKLKRGKSVKMLEYLNDSGLSVTVKATSPKTP